MAAAPITTSQAGSPFDHTNLDAAEHALYLVHCRMPQTQPLCLSSRYRLRSEPYVSHSGAPARIHTDFDYDRCVV